MPGETAAGLDRHLDRYPSTAIEPDGPSNAARPGRGPAAQGGEHRGTGVGGARVVLVSQPDAPICVQYDETNPWRGDAVDDAGGNLRQRCPVATAGLDGSLPRSPLDGEALGGVACNGAGQGDVDEHGERQERRRPASRRTRWSGALPVLARHRRDTPVRSRGSRRSIVFQSSLRV